MAAKKSEILVNMLNNMEHGIRNVRRLQIPADTHVFIVEVKGTLRFQRGPFSVCTMQFGLTDKGGSSELTTGDSGGATGAGREQRVHHRRAVYA